MSIARIAAVVGVALYSTVTASVLAAAGAVFGDILGLWHLGTAC